MNFDINALTLTSVSPSNKPHQISKIKTDFKLVIEKIDLKINYETEDLQLKLKLKLFKDNQLFLSTLSEFNLDEIGLYINNQEGRIILYDPLQKIIHPILKSIDFDQTNNIKDFQAINQLTFKFPKIHKVPTKIFPIQSLNTFNIETLNIYIPVLEKIQKHYIDFINTTNTQIVLEKTPFIKSIHYLYSPHQLKIKVAEYIKV